MANTRLTSPRAPIQEAVDHLRDVVIVDTAGRLQIDEQMMQEAVDIKKAVKPDQVLMVVDAHDRPGYRQRRLDLR